MDNRAPHTRRRLELGASLMNGEVKGELAPSCFCLAKIPGGL